MIKAVVDTNTLASGFVRRKETSAVVQVIDAWGAGLFTLVVSDHIIDELTRTFEGPYFQAYLTTSQRARRITLLREDAVLTPINTEVHNVATHPEDDLVLATAVSSHADYLVTGDTKLLKLGSYQDVSIISPRQFVDILTAERPKD